MDECRIEEQARIFLGFSSIDRYEVVESVLYHLANYGIAIWYDRHKMRLGDFYNNIFYNGILNTKYAVIIFTANTDNADCFTQEVEYIKRQYDKGEIKVFPLLYKTTIQDLPEKFDWIRNLIYKEFDDKSGTGMICNQIVSSILTDELNSCKHQNLHELLGSLSQDENYNYIKKILSSYLDVDRSNHNSRIAILYCLYVYIISNHSVQDMFPQHHWRCFDRMFSFTKLHLDIDQREILILEISIMLLLNKLHH